MRWLGDENYVISHILHWKLIEEKLKKCISLEERTNPWSAQTSTPSVHEDITQIATLQVIKQCHKWDKRGRPETRRRYRESLAPLLRFSDMERVRRTFKTVLLKWERIGYDLWHALIFAGIRRFSCVRKRNVAAKGSQCYPHLLCIKGTFDSISTTARERG